METNTISMYETVIDRNNKKHKVFSLNTEAGNQQKNPCKNNCFPYYLAIV